MSTHPVIDHLAKEERIRAIAYAIWEEEGRPDGQAETHWLRACEIVEAEAVEPQPVEPNWLKRAEEAVNQKLAAARAEEPAIVKPAEPRAKVA